MRPRKPGRPRNVETQATILSVAREILLAEGLGRLSIEAVAARAGVGKPTIYRNWRNAHELAMAALLADLTDKDEPDRRASLEVRLKQQLRSLIDTFDTVRGRQITLTLAAADHESELAKAFRTQIALKSREVGRSLLLSAETQGEVELEGGIETVLDLIYAPIFYRLLIGHQPLTRELANGIVDKVMYGISPKKH